MVVRLVFYFYAAKVALAFLTGLINEHFCPIFPHLYCRATDQRLSKISNPLQCQLGVIDLGSICHIPCCRKARVIMACSSPLLSDLFILIPSIPLSTATPQSWPTYATAAEQLTTPPLLLSSPLFFYFMYSAFNIRPSLSAHQKQEAYSAPHAPPTLTNTTYHISSACS